MELAIYKRKIGFHPLPNLLKKYLKKSVDDDSRKNKQGFQWR